MTNIKIGLTTIDQNKLKEDIKIGTQTSTTFLRMDKTLSKDTVELALVTIADGSVRFFFSGRIYTRGCHWIPLMFA
jgi:hypothetical protein